MVLFATRSAAHQVPTSLSLQTHTHTHTRVSRDERGSAKILNSHCAWAPIESELDGSNGCCRFESHELFLDGPGSYFSSRANWIDSYIHFASLISLLELEIRTIFVCNLNNKYQSKHVRRWELFPSRRYHTILHEILHVNKLLSMLLIKRARRYLGQWRIFVTFWWRRFEHLGRWWYPTGD